MSAGQHRQANGHIKPTTRGQRIMAKLGVKLPRRQCACGGVLRGNVLHSMRGCSTWRN